MQALSVTLNAHVLLTVFEEAGGWRFGSWERRDGGRLPQPPDVARSMQFSSPLAAADFFRALHALNWQTG
jgi:hypothetical protein